MTLAEIVQVMTPIGSAVGLATGLFVLIDRLSAGRPIADWSATTGEGAKFTITNNSTRYLHVRAGGMNRRLIWGLATVNLKTEYQFDVAPDIAVIAPGSSRDFQVEPLGIGDWNGWHLIVIPWSRGWFPELPLVLVLNWRKMNRLV